jgi:hypothetical protein
MNVRRSVVIGQWANWQLFRPRDKNVTFLKLSKSSNPYRVAKKREMTYRAPSGRPSAIHIPACGARLDPAPTELIATFRALAIKILLIRSIWCLSHGSNCRGLKQKIAPVRESFGGFRNAKLQAALPPLYYDPARKPRNESYASAESVDGTPLTCSQQLASFKRHLNSSSSCDSDYGGWDKKPPGL